VQSISLRGKGRSGLMRQSKETRTADWHGATWLYRELSAREGLPISDDDFWPRGEGSSHRRARCPVEKGYAFAKHGTNRILGRAIAIHELARSRTCRPPDGQSARRHLCPNEGGRLCEQTPHRGQLSHLRASCNEDGLGFHLVPSQPSGPARHRMGIRSKARAGVNRDS
jgi:hypothetical protein